MHHLHAQEPEGLDQGKGLEGAAHVDRRLLAGQLLPVPFAVRASRVFSSSWTSFLARASISSSLEKSGHGVKRFGHVLDAEVGDPDDRGCRTSPSSSWPGPWWRPEHCTTFRAAPWARWMSSTRPSPVMLATTSTPDPLVVFADHPDLAGQVEIAEDVDAVLGDALGVAGADQPEHGVAGRLVAGPLVALEAFGLDRQHRDAFLRRHPFADRLQVVADDADDAGGVDEGRLGLVAVDQLGRAPR